MNIDNFEKLMMEIIDTEFIPQMTNTEKAVYLSAQTLGIINYSDIKDRIFANEYLKNSNIWTDNSKTSVNDSKVKEVLTNIINSNDGSRFVFKGIEFDMIFKKVVLFSNYVIDIPFVERVSRLMEKY